MPTLSPQQVARALGGDVNGANSVLAPGPGHSAVDRSLSIKLDPNAPDNFLVHSFAGDDTIACKDYVRQRLGLPAFKPNGGTRRASSEEIEELFRTALQSQRQDSPKKGIHAATYRYKDRDGTVLYEVLRFDQPKTFRQRRPDGNGGWIWNLDGVRRVLYRLQELLKFPDGTVFVTEGEKDADRVADLGHCSTTVASGVWRGVDLEPLRDRDTIVLEDADEPGNKKAIAAATALHGIAKTIRIVRLPELTGEKDNKDVSDWLRDPRNADRLVDICFDASIWAPVAAHDQKEPASAEESSERSTNKPTEKPRPRLVATPFIWRNPAVIPPRHWIYGWHYIRKFISATIAPGALGKSSLQLVEAIAIALKLPLLGSVPTEQCNVWYWNGEDPAEETERRIAAICARYNINGKDLEGRLFTDTGRLTPIKLAALKKGELVLDGNLAHDLCYTIRENEIGVTIFDPFISVHDVPESDNTNIDAVVKRFGHIADETNTSIEFAHHVRKPSSSQAEITVEDARGASALIHAVRSARVLNRMNKEQAAELKIEQPRFYFRSDNGKANLRPPEAAQWWRLANVDLPNGDQVGVVEAWNYPNPMARITTDHMHKARAKAAEGAYRKDPRSDDWIGRVVAEVADLDPDDKADMAIIKAALKAWFANGVLATEERKDESRRTRQFVVPGNWNEET